MRLVSLILLVMLSSSAATTQTGAVLEALAARKNRALAQETAGIAKASLRAYLEGKPAPMIRPKSAVLRRQAGAFVTLLSGGRVRGCMGNLDPQEADIAHEIAANVISAARGDARYRPISLRELPKLHYYISIIGPRRRVSSISEISPSRHGLLVEWNGRGGVLLPGEARTAHWQVAECRRKAGIPPKAPVHMWIFETVVLEYGP